MKNCQCATTTLQNQFPDVQCTIANLHVESCSAKKLLICAKRQQKVAFELDNYSLFKNISGGRYKKFIYIAPPPFGIYFYFLVQPKKVSTLFKILALFYDNKNNFYDHKKKKNTCLILYFSL